MLRFAATAVAPLIVGGTLLVASPQADAACGDTPVPASVNPDCFFLWMVKNRGITNSYGDAQMISDAHAICDDLHNMGGGIGAVAEQVLQVEKASGLSRADAALLVGAARSAYCPWE